MYQCQYNDNSTHNLVKKELLIVFENVTYLEIKCLGYPFSLSAFLDVIIGTKIAKVVIHGDGWLSELLSSSSYPNICDKYEKAKFRLNLVDFMMKNCKLVLVNEL